ncbi:hypothetical protein AB7828_03560 [Tardiphaga sp. 215_C5_N2_1]|uniref:hypothetical protein n=1 Tax=Tardiphaga sp. 215_C5_N2_1 TaxID=3240774 RepID=UPI003F8A96C2
MTPDQKKAFDAVMGYVHRGGMKIAEIADPNERAVAIELARRAITETAAEQGMTDSKLIEACTSGVEFVVREIVQSGQRQGGNA